MITLTQEQVEAIREMRRLQKAFFQGDKTVVGRAKAAERKVDMILDSLPGTDEPGLFHPADYK